jgi:uncharacterized protein with PIN domain
MSELYCPNCNATVNGIPEQNILEGLAGHQWITEWERCPSCGKVIRKSEHTRRFRNERSRW